MNTIVKATTKGQITIPMAWRKRFNTDRFLIDVKDSHLEIKPFDINKIAQEEYTVFDAIRDNNGKGIKAKDLLKIIKKTL
ncbi:MAG TPA: hypothetical protein DEB09_01170 [Candidatus Magasanikbacteria bacterium]|nr:hypothetical protein [Candidatus Magasanikbacteria bacterium]